ncbi:syntaxin-16 [Uranotaenia lowii]|uniref:syntaxin-16 n=1 Tax=Uranotaenia lowii TaxID=190385 RepID=UPI002479C4F8|nr:syntaxin-16 [Uranotaenia lowii]
MSKRNLSELFFMLRNNVLYSKNIYSEGQPSDNLALLNNGPDNNVLEHPIWIGRYEEIHYLLSKIKTRIDDLLNIQNNTVRSVLSESVEDEKKIESLTKEISKLIATCHGQIKSIKSYSKGNNNLERVMLQNVERSSMISLQHVTETFRINQTTYMDKQKSLLKKSKEFFETMPCNFEGVPKNSVETFDNFLNMDVPSTSPKGLNYDNDDDKLDEYFQLPSSGISINQKQMLLIESDNTKMISSREQEVKHIVNSIVDLNVIFKDLSQLVQEQGTILDRIDYNIETTQTRVIEGYKQLQKAEKFQRKNRKMFCIVILASMIMFMIILTVFTKF